MGKHNVCYFLAEEQQHRSASSWQGAGRVGFISLRFIYQSIKHSIRLHFLEVTKGRKSSIRWSCLSSSLLTAAVVQVTNKLKYVTQGTRFTKRNPTLSFYLLYFYLSLNRNGHKYQVDTYFSRATAWKLGLFPRKLFFCHDFNSGKLKRLWKLLLFATASQNYSISAMRHRCMPRNTTPERALPRESEIHLCWSYHKESVGFFADVFSTIQWSQVQANNRAYSSVQTSTV